MFPYPCILFGIILDTANLVHGISCGSHNTIHPLPPLLSLLSSLLFIALHYLLLFIKQTNKQKTSRDEKSSCLFMSVILVIKYILSGLFLLF